MEDDWQVSTVIGSPIFKKVAVRINWLYRINKISIRVYGYLELTKHFAFIIFWYFFLFCLFLTIHVGCDQSEILYIISLLFFCDLYWLFLRKFWLYMLTLKHLFCSWTLHENVSFRICIWSFEYIASFQDCCIKLCISI